MPRLSRIVSEQIENPSPIRQIMKMADRKNIMAMGLNPDDVISFGGGWVNHPAPERLVEIYRELSSDPKMFHSSGGYSATLGTSECRDALMRLETEVMGIKGLEIDNIVIGQSSTQLTHDLFVTILDPGDMILMPDPTYANYPGQLVFSVPSIKAERFRVLDPENWIFVPDEDEVIEDVKEKMNDQVRAVLFPAPDNPTSQILPDDVVTALMDLTADAHAFLLIDAAYRTQCFHGMPSYLKWSPADHENLVIIHSNSKWGRGLGRRMGWLIAHSAVIEGLERVQQCTILCPDSLHQMAMTAYLNEAIDDRSLYDYLDQVRRMYEMAADVTIKAIDEYLGFPRLVPEGGLYTVMHVGVESDVFVLDVLRNTGVLFIPGGGFGPSLRLGVRISYGPLVNEPDRIRTGFERVGTYLRKK